MSTAVDATARTGRVTWLGTLRSEAVKLFSLRSTWWVLGIGVAAYVLFQWGTVWGLTGAIEDSGVASLADLDGTYLMVVVAGMLATTSAILGVLTLTSEYATGMIRSTLAAQPGRLSVLSAKAVLVSLTIAVQTVVAFLGTWVVTNSLVADALGTGVSLAAGSTWAIIGLFVLYTVTCALMGLGIAAIVRSTAGGISAVLVLLMLVPIVLEFLPWDWVAHVRDLLPSNLATDYLSPSGGILGVDAAYDDAVGASLSAAWAAVLLVAGGAVMVRRDA